MFYTSPFEAVPPLAGGSGLLGHFRKLRHDRLGHMRRMGLSMEPIVRLRILANHLLVMNSPETVYEVLVGQSRAFEKSPVLRTGLYPLAGDGLFTSEGALWKRQRRLMAPIFRFKGLARYADAMAACAERGASLWRDGEVVDIARETTRIAMGVAGMTLFAADTFADADTLGDALTEALEWTNEQVASPVLVLQAQTKTRLRLASERTSGRLSRALARAAEALHKPILLPGARTRRLEAALSVLEARVERMIDDRLNADADAHDDLLAQLLAARDDEDGLGMSRKQVRDEVLTLFVAGHETTASGLAWSLYALARDPEIYARAQAEADALTGDRVGFDDLPRLTYCQQIFKEALRLYSPVYMFGRVATSDLAIGGVDIPNGTIVLISPYAMHHRPDLWPDPERFDPERFTPEAEEARPRCAYIPFSDGPRICIGNHFALMEGPIVLATLLRRARFSTPPGAPPAEPFGSITLRPRGGIPLRVSLRAQDPV